MPLFATKNNGMWCAPCLRSHPSAYNGEEQYETLYTMTGMDLPTDKTWVDRFWPHFLIVSAVVYLIILCTVLIGTAIPAAKIVGTRITNALRDE